MNERALIPPRNGEGDHSQDGGGVAHSHPTPPSALRAATSPFRGGVRDQFPAIPAGWHYLDTAATAQKPQAVIDAITNGYARDYATVHRGVYQRSSNMTLAYEAARTATATFLNAATPDEIVFTKGATEAINLVAQALPKEGRDRVLLSALEHHSNIVPWQLAGYAIDVCPLTGDGQIDLDAAEALITDRTRVVAFAHVSNVLGSVLDARRAADIAHAYGALLLLDGCQAAPRLTVDVRALGCDYYAFSGHKLYGPTGIGALYGRAALLETMTPWQGGGAMIDRVTFAGTTYAPPPGRFEAGTPHIVGALGLPRRDRLGRGDRSRPAPCARGGPDPNRPRSPAPHEQRAPVRPRRIGRNRQFRLRRGASARRRHHPGRCRGRDPRRPPLRAAADGRARRAGDRPGELRRLQRCADDVAALVEGLSRVKRIFG